MEDIYDEMEKQNKKFCEFCKEWCDEEDYDKEYGGCQFCMENDDEYNS